MLMRRSNIDQNLIQSHVSSSHQGDNSSSVNVVWFPPMPFLAKFLAILGCAFALTIFHNGISSIPKFIHAVLLTSSFSFPISSESLRQFRAAIIIASTHTLEIWPWVFQAFALSPCNWVKQRVHAIGDLLVHVCFIEIFH